MLTVTENFEHEACDLVLLQEPGCNSASDFNVSGFRLLAGPVPEAPAILFHKNLPLTVTKLTNLRYWCILSCVVSGISYCFVSIHLPDHGSLRKSGLNLRGLWNLLDDELSERWCEHPWSVLFWGGDLNTALDASDVTDSASYHIDRLDILRDFSAKWGLTWSECNSPTHCHYQTGALRVIDYVHVGAVVGLSISHSTRVSLACSFASDHRCLITELGVRRAGRRSRADFLTGKPKQNRPSFANFCRNRFQALMEDAVGSDSQPGTACNSLEAFSEGLISAATLASSASPSPDPPRVSFGNLLALDILQADSLVDGAERKAALRAISHRRRRLVKDKKVADFKLASLNLPRDDRPRKSSQPVSMIVDGLPCFDPVQWEAEFKLLYRNLLDDPFNTFEHQQDRLDRLRRLCSGSGRIDIPLWAIHECLAKGRSKGKSAPGADGITWQLLSALPDHAVIALRNLFEGRLNCEEGLCDSIADWCRILITLIPKTNNAVTFASWRPISLTSVLQKLYLSVCSILLREFGRPIHECQYGFCPGKQVMEVSECLRLILEKTAEWDLPACILKIDAHRAFDSMRHDILEQCLLDAEVNPKLVLAFMRELSFGTGTLRFGDLVWEDAFSYTKGGRQGGCDTPELWKRYLNVALSRASRVWAEEGLGLILPSGLSLPGEVRVDVLAWADDLFIVARSIPDLHRMWCILSTAFSDIALTWKPGSLEILDNSRPAGGLSISWSGDAGDFTVKIVHELIALGVALDTRGSTVCSVHFRMAEARRHFFAREAVLCKRCVP